MIDRSGHWVLLGGGLKVGLQLYRFYVRCCGLIMEGLSYFEDWRSLRPVTVVTCTLECLRFSYTGITLRCWDVDLVLLGVMHWFFVCGSFVGDQGD